MKRLRARRGVTMVELMVAIGMVATLAALGIASIGRMRTVAQGAHCANSLRQLGAATSSYLAEHNYKCFDLWHPVPGGKLWYFGFETTASGNMAEGSRTVDQTQSPLWPYITQVGGIQVCPSFPYKALSMWKPKYAGASWGYGYNYTLSSSVDVLTLPNPSGVLLFGDCAYVNTFQPPASPKNPMLEEFYFIDGTYKTIHFRHGGLANILFLDGHVEKFTMYPGTQDMKLPAAMVGRITPSNSSQYLR